MPKKFKNEDEYQTAVHAIEWGAWVSSDRYAEEMRERIHKAKQAHSTSSLDDALFLLRLFEEKIKEHNGRCKQHAGKMKTIYYKRDNIQE